MVKHIGKFVLAAGMFFVAISTAAAAGLEQFAGCYRTVLWEGLPIKLKDGQAEKVGSIELIQSSIYSDLNGNKMDAINVSWFVGDFWLGEMVGKTLLTQQSVTEVSQGKFETRYEGDLLGYGTREHLSQNGTIERLANGDVAFKYVEEHDGEGRFGSDAILRPAPCTQAE